MSTPSPSSRALPLRQRTVLASGVALLLAACGPIVTTAPSLGPASAPPSGAPSASADPAAQPVAMPSQQPDYNNYAPKDGVNGWPAPADTAAAIKAAGLDALPQEGFAVHIHPHLDVYNQAGQHVIVPALIGIDPQGRFISPLHTHVNSGVMHIESPKSVTLTLGHFFKEWGVPLAGAKAWVNGQAVASPADAVLSDHAEIVVAFGPPPAPIPASWSPASGSGDWF